MKLDMYAHPTACCEFKDSLGNLKFLTSDFDFTSSFEIFNVPKEWSSFIKILLASCLSCDLNMDINIIDFLESLHQDAFQH